MEINGTIKTLLETGGTSAAGNNWKLQTAIIETTDVYPKTVAIEIFGDQRIMDFSLKEGETVTFSIDVESREAKGRWFTSARAWKVERPNGLATPPAGLPKPAPQGAPSVFPQPASAAPHQAAPVSTDLPF